MFRVLKSISAVSIFVAAIVYGNGGRVHADVAKGQWGHVTPIADNNHPNLYYNQSEITELRNMILTQKSPQALVDLYTSKFKDVVAQPTYADDYSDTNARAAVSYMIEPTPAKAAAIRTALLSYESNFPGGFIDWYTTGGCHFCGYWAPWLFDLVQAYHPNTLSASEIANLKNFFKASSDHLKFNSRDQCAVAPGSDACDSSSYVASVTTREGKRMAEFPNWYARYMGPALACALVSGDQADVDYWADSGWPHDLYTYDGVDLNGSFPSNNANRFDLVMHLRAVYPSGANTDTYIREGYNVTAHTWSTVYYTWGGYHYAATIGAMLGSEMAYHNGMTGVFGITDAGTEPALLRTYKLAIQSRTESDAQALNTTGHPIIGWDPLILMGLRRYSDPTLEGAAPGVLNYYGPRVDGSVGTLDGFDVPSSISQLFSYPRHVLYTTGGSTPPPPPPPPVSPSGTYVPPASNIIDDSGNSWTLGAGSPNKPILVNGSQAGTGAGSKILWFQNVIYALGTDSRWWRWTGETWVSVGADPNGPQLSCDVNLSGGAVDVGDVQYEVAGILNSSLCLPATMDINKINSCDVGDVQRIVNVILGGTCVIGP